MNRDVEGFIWGALKGSGTDRPKRILELGSYIMHGHDPRPLFPGALYVGVDARPGPGVDIVGLAHDVEVFGEFDVVLSLQALEHDPYWPKTLQRGVQLLKPHGMLIVTCAGPGWRSHEPDATPEPGHYENVSVFDVVSTVMRAAQGREVAGVHGRYIWERQVNHPRTCCWLKLGPPH